MSSPVHPRHHHQQVACQQQTNWLCMQFISHINMKRSPSLPESSPAVSSPRQNARSPKPSSPTHIQAAHHIPLQLSKARADTSQCLEAPPCALSEEIPPAATSAAAPSFSSSQRDRDTFLSSSKAPEDRQPQSSHEHQNYEAVRCSMIFAYVVIHAFLMCMHAS